MPPPEALALRGLRAVGGFAVPAAALERLDALAREADPQAAGAIRATPQLLAALGWKPGQAEQILRGLGFTRAKQGRRARSRSVAQAADDRRRVGAS